MVDKERLLHLFPFDTYRPYQEAVLTKAIEAFERGVKHVAINAPVGFGKSAVALTLSRWFGASYVSTTQKSLQRQYCYDFDLQELYGKSNYKCIKDIGMTCDNPTCTKDKCDNCPYLTARNACLSSDVAIMNYSLLFSLKCYSPLIEERPIAIYDEAHNLEDQITDFISIHVSTNTFKKHNVQLIPLPSPGEKMPSVIRWLVEKLKPHLSNTKDQIEVALDGCYNKQLKADLGIQFSLVDKFLCQTNRMIGFLHEGGKVAVQVDDESVTIRPLMVDKFAIELLSGISDKMVYISATLPSKDLFCRTLGIVKDDLQYIQVGSVFPPENRPVFYAPIGKMSYSEKAQTLPKMAKAVDQILSSSKHNGERGIIHTSSYDIANYIYNQSRFKNRLVFPKAANKERVMREFYESDRDDLVLISPSLMEGIDLKGDLARFSIICKLPFASLGDNWVKEKMEAIDGWYAEQTVCKLVQSTGRHIRSETETGVTYILDGSFQWFYTSNQRRFPLWWTESLIMKG